MARLLISIVLFLAAAIPAAAQSPATKPPAQTAPTSAAASDQFKTEDAAKAHCPGDTIVWATLSRAKAYHLSGDRSYGKTRRGAYMCKADADKAGMHQAGRRTTSAGSKSSTSGAAH